MDAFCSLNDAKLRSAGVTVMEDVHTHPTVASTEAAVRRGIRVPGGQGLHPANDTEVCRTSGETQPGRRIGRGETGNEHVSFSLSSLDLQVSCCLAEIEDSG